MESWSTEALYKLNSKAVSPISAILMETTVLLLEVSHFGFIIWTLSQYNFTDQYSSPGHIYVPSVGKCLTANPDSNGSSGGPPFTFGLSDCYYSDDSGQVFSNFVKQSDGKIYYVGT